MVRRRSLASVLALPLALGTLPIAACSKKSAEGLPPAQEWGGGSGQAAAQPQPQAMPSVAPAAQMGLPTTNPHANVPGAPGGPPAAGGGGDGEDPHAGVDMTNPHAGVDMTGAAGGGADVAKLGLPSPDPSRPLDPTHHIRGVIRIHPKAASRATAGGALFVIAKRADDKGQPSGPPLAVEKLSWPGNELAFELTEANAMIGGTQLAGDVVVTVRYDQDGDAISKQPGDIVGQARVTVPADKLVVTLDDVLP